MPLPFELDELERLHSSLPVEEREELLLLQRREAVSELLDRYLLGLAGRESIKEFPD